MGKENLENIIYEMLAKEDKNGRILTRGLALAYSPVYGDGNAAGSRFVWSRRGVDPSEIEDGIMRTAVLKAMKRYDKRVVVGGPVFRTGLQLRHGWASSMLYWKWVGTAELLSLKGRERDRAMEWMGR